MVLVETEEKIAESLDNLSQCVLGLCVHATRHTKDNLVG